MIILVVGFFGAVGLRETKCNLMRVQNMTVLPFSRFIRTVCQNRLPNIQIWKYHMQTVADVYDSKPKIKNQLPRDFGRGLSFLKNTNNTNGCTYNSFYGISIKNNIALATIWCTHCNRLITIIKKTLSFNDNSCGWVLWSCRFERNEV